MIDDKPIVIIPTNDTLNVPADIYVDIIRQVPCGQVTTMETIFQFLATKYGVKKAALDPDMSIQFMMAAIDQRDPAPFWRILSERGYLGVFERYSSKETQEHKLKAEGIPVVPVGTTTALRVPDFKQYLFDLRRIADCLPSKEQLDTYKTRHPALLHGVGTAIGTILNRRSIRRYTQRTISDADIETILKAGMSGPSCVNARDWSFIVVKNPEMLGRMADANGRPAEPLRTAKLGILICGDLERAFPNAKDYWVIDGAIAGQNMVLAAEALGIGSVWLGTWPQMDRVRKQAELFGLPEYIVPHSILAFGYPAETVAKDKQEWEANRIHYEKW